MKKKLKKLDKKMIIISSVIFIIFLTVIFASFALPNFLVDLKGQVINRIDSCSIEITIAEGQQLTLLNSYPMDDDEIGKYNPYEVTITNNSQCDKLKFNFKMVSSCDNCSKNNDGDCVIGEDTCDCDNQIDEDLIKYQIVNDTTKREYIGTNPYDMDITESLEINESVKYKIRIWISSDATEDDLYIDQANNTTKDFCARIETIVLLNTPTIPTITASDNVLSDAWHTANFNLNFSGSTIEDSSRPIYYFYSTDGLNWTNNTSVAISSETANTLYQVKACSNIEGSMCSESATYVAKLDKTGPVCTYNATGTKASDSKYYYKNYFSNSSNSNITSTLETDWYSNETATTYKLVCTDNFSGVSTYYFKDNSNSTIKSYVRGSNVNETITGYAMDNLGNVTEQAFSAKITGRGVLETDYCGLSTLSCDWVTGGSYFSKDSDYRYCTGTVWRGKSQDCYIGGGYYRYYISYTGGYSTLSNYSSGSYKSQALQAGSYDAGFRDLFTYSNYDWYFWLINKAGIVSYPIRYNIENYS